MAGDGKYLYKDSAVGKEYKREHENGGQQCIGTIANSSQSLKHLPYLCITDDNGTFVYRESNVTHYVFLCMWPKNLKKRCYQRQIYDN